MKFSSIAERLLKGESRQTRASGDEDVVRLLVSEEASNWNKFALLMSSEDEKLPSARSGQPGAVRVVPKHRVFCSYRLTTAQWNELALRPPVASPDGKGAPSCAVGELR